MNPNDGTDAPRVVLDANVVLDWLLFDDPMGRQVGRAVMAGELRWVATPAMRDEHFDVIARPRLQGNAPDGAAHRRAWHSHCEVFDLRAAASGMTPVPCADPDDQMFIDLALATGAAWLLSRDKAVLVLEPRLRPRGIRVATPATWVSTRAAAGAAAA